MKLAEIADIIKAIRDSKKDAIMIFRNGAYQVTVVGEVIKPKKK